MLILLICNAINLLSFHGHVHFLGQLSVNPKTIESIKLFPTNIFILFAICQNGEEAGCYSFYSAEYVHCLSTRICFTTM